MGEIGGYGDSGCEMYENKAGSDYVHQYRHIASGFCYVHGWFQHQDGHSGCDKCDADEATDEMRRAAEKGPDGYIEVDAASASHVYWLGPDGLYCGDPRVIAQLDAAADGVNDQLAAYQRHVTQLANQVEERDHMLAEMAVQLRDALAEMRRLEDAQVRLIRSVAGKVDVGPEAMPERALGHCWAAGKFPR